MQVQKPAETIPDHPAGFATVAQASQYLQISRAKVYALMGAGELTHAKFGSSRRIPWAALVEYGERNIVGR